MDGSYPNPSFADPLDPAQQQQPAAWAYERGPACVKPSSGYGATHLETELLQRQTYASSQLSTYTTSQTPAGLSGVFDTSLQTSGSNATETPVMNFLSAIESRSLQAGPASASLPQFRSWQTGANSSNTDLFLAGALPSSGTFPTPSALSSYQHPSIFSTRSFTTSPALPLQDVTFSSSNGLLPPQDPLLQIKSSQSTVPTALAFDRLSATSIGPGLPPQSSTYRSAQESAPHLLQPQFSLLPSALGNPQPALQPYGAPAFSGPMERALQRECSVIKHHQRPSSTQLPAGAPHPLQTFLAGESGVPFPAEASRQTSVPCSPVGDAAHPINGGPQQTSLQTQAYPSSVPSPGFSPSPGMKAKDCSSSNMAQRSNKSAESEPRAQAGSPKPPTQTFSSPGQKPNSAAASQPQPYAPAQIPDLMSMSPSHNYITSQSLSGTVSHPQVFSTGQTEKMPSVYKFSFAGQSESVTSAGLAYSLPSAVHGAEYGAQVQGLCMGSPSPVYSPGHTQGPPNASYYAAGPAAAGASRSYATEQSLPPASSFSPARAGVEPLKFLLPVQLPSSSQALHRGTPSAELKPAYGKRKEDGSMFLAKEGCGELPIQDVQALQRGTLQSSTQALAGNESGGQNNVVYVVSKADDRYNTQSVIRSNSRSEDHMMGSPLGSIKDERLMPTNQHGQLVDSSSARVGPEPKSSSALMQSSHVAMNAEQLKPQSLLLKVPGSQQQNHQAQTITIQQDHKQTTQGQTQFVCVPGAPVLLEPSQMIVLQQTLPHTVQTSKVTTQMQPVQYLQMTSDINPPTVSIAESSKHNTSPKVNFSQTSQHDGKHHFTLGSICFPDSMLMTDERTILSNVDDILAATVAACGVTPHDFVKAASSEGEMPSLANPTDSKCHFQSAESRNEPTFTPQQGIIANTQTLTLTLNSTHLTSDIQHFPKSGVGSHQAYLLENLHAQHGVNSIIVSSQHEVDGLTAQSHETGDGEAAEKSSATPKNVASLSPSDNSDGRVSSDFHLTGQEYNPTVMMNHVSKSQEQVPSSEANGIKKEDILLQCPADGLPKKKSRSKGSSRFPCEDENGLPRPPKRSGQGKRQNGKGSDIGSSSASDSCQDGYQHQERIRQKIKEVEEKQPEIRTGFIGSFLDFLKSGPKQNFSSPQIRTPNRTRKSSSVSKKASGLLPMSYKLQPPLAPLPMQENQPLSSTRRLDEDLQKNLVTLPSFSSDEDEAAGKNQALQNSITSALSSLDEPSDRKQKPVDRSAGDLLRQQQYSSVEPSPVKVPPREISAEELLKDVPPDHLALQLMTVAIEGLTDEELSDSGGEGMYRERDEFVVKNEDIESLKVTLKAGLEPPAIWKVQKALLQKFIPELRDGRRVFSATNSYLGYFGDAKTMYRRVYVKFLDTVNKREYVRVCSRKPRCKPMHSMRGSQAKALFGHKILPVNSSIRPASNKLLSKLKAKQPKSKAEPPPKKRRKWKEAFSPSDSSPEASSEADEFTPPVSFSSRFLNTRTMKETFKGFVELLISVTLDADVMSTLERGNDELLLPHMKRVDCMITDNRRRLLPKLCVGQLFKSALDTFPEISVVTELKKDGETPAFKVCLSGKAYNKKTMKPSKSPSKLPLEYTVDQQTKTRWFSLYHSLQHYKYHTYLTCRDEIASLKLHAQDLRQEQTVQICMSNRAWVERLFDRFGELLTQVQQACL
uniref:DUF4211 domain-containing protein n=1 Tax=Denticeps clupeoides TaxID=299321 RepID=A0A8C4FNR3_9TELE